MAQLPEPFYLTQDAKESSVLLCGKSPELVQKDIDAGIARIGGFFRCPDYARAYILAADTLLRTALQERSLDHHSLPIFFLQRHATELLIKEPLQLGIRIHEYWKSFGRKLPPNFPSNRLVERVSRSHDLEQLLRDLETMVSAFQLSPLPAMLSVLVNELLAFEKDHTWARYSYHHPNKDSSQTIVHIDKEITIPLVAIQKHLQSACDALGSTYPADDNRLNVVLGSMIGECVEIEDALK